MNESLEYVKYETMPKPENYHSDLMRIKVYHGGKFLSTVLPLPKELHDEVGQSLVDLIKFAMGEDAPNAVVVQTVEWNSDTDERDLAKEILSKLGVDTDTDTANEIISKIRVNTDETPGRG